VEPDLILSAPTRELTAGVRVKRALPSARRRSVGPIVFLDQMGPVVFGPGQSLDVRPHPHIGLATVTYLFEGAMIHRDSLGSIQRIEPGDVNWMTAGRGIVHSERTPAEERPGGQRLHGLQTWVALPVKDEQREPSFNHHPKASLPLIELRGATMQLIAGSAFGERAPTPTFSPIFYLAVEMHEGAAFDLPPEHEERGVYAIEGELGVGDAAVAPHQLAVLPQGETVRIRAAKPSRLVLLGGAKMDGDRLIWWNFVASSRALIDAASARWREQAFPPVPGETEFIPLPEP